MADDAIIAGVRAALARTPGDVALRVHLAELLLAAGRPDDAAREAALALSQDPASPTAAGVLARSRETPAWQQQRRQQTRTWPQAEQWQQADQRQQPDQWHQPQAAGRGPGRRAVLVLVGAVVVAAAAIALTVVLVGRGSPGPHAVPAAERAVVGWTKANNAKDIPGVKALTCRRDRTSTTNLIGQNADTDDISKSELVGDDEAVVYEKLTIRKGSRGLGTTHDGVHPLYVNALERVGGSWQLCFDSVLGVLASDVTTVQDCASRTTASPAQYPQPKGSTLALSGCRDSLIANGDEVRYDVSGSSYQLCVTREGTSYNFDRTVMSVSVSTDPACRSGVLGA